VVGMRRFMANFIAAALVLSAAGAVAMITPASATIGPNSKLDGVYNRWLEASDSAASQYWTGRASSRAHALSKIAGVRAQPGTGSGNGFYAWGQITGTTNGPAVPSPTLIGGIAGTIVQISTSSSTDYALTSNGQVWAWGLGKNGQLGNDTEQNAFNNAVLVQFPPGVTIESLPNPMPFDTAMAIDANGDIWGWGLNANDSLCMGRRDIKLPKQINALTNVTLASGQGGHGLYYSNATLYACGLNREGELGNGSTTDSSTPVPVLGLPDEPVIALVSSWQGSGALMQDGTYYDWGYNRSGQMGDGNTTDVDSATLVNLEAPVAEIFQGGSYSTNGQTLALLSDGTVWGWGSNSTNQLSPDNTQRYLAPISIEIPNGVTWIYVATNGATSYAIDSNGNLWDWGANASGQIGNGTTGGIIPIPTQVSGLSNITQVCGTAKDVTAY